ncbi:hypothetical protein OROGR_000298 [Orobanche gracilis]
MGTLQNQSPNPHPTRSILVPHSNTNLNQNRSILPHSNPTPILSPNPNPNQKPAPGPKSPSFEEVSKLFSLPLFSAADSLGICPSVLKKVCYDNGLVRWPYRKFLSGKSIEEIKKDAAVEKEKQLTESKVAGERNVSLASSAVSFSLGPQLGSTSAGPSQGNPTFKMPTQPPTISNQFVSSDMNASTRSKSNSSISDEYKYGFPLDGLSSVSYRWWGNKSADKNVIDSKEGDIDKNEHQPKELENTAAANLSSVDEEVTEGKKHESIDADSEWASSLSTLRRKMAKDGQQALGLGVYRGYDGVKTLDRAKKHLLSQIFKSSLPRGWGDVC